MVRTPADSIIGPRRGMLLRPVRRPRPGRAGRQTARTHGHALTGTEWSQAYLSRLQQAWWTNEHFGAPITAPTFVGEALAGAQLEGL